VLIGQSGCGKSTLLRMIMGLTQPDSGQIWIENKELRPETIQKLRIEMGYVIQEGGLFPHLTGEQNICLMADYLKWPKDKTKKRLEELSELTQINSDCLKRYPHQLSGGQRQRMSLMRALFLYPKILLMDEPMGALDPMIRSELQQDLKKIFQKLQKTVLIVTHDLKEAYALGHEVVLLEKGKIIQKGAFSELLENPSTPFVKKFMEPSQTAYA
jgi:osmoprotectant transport system ATP-binding protein